MKVAYAFRSEEVKMRVNLRRHPATNRNTIEFVNAVCILIGNVDHCRAVRTDFKVNDISVGYQGIADLGDGSSLHRHAVELVYIIGVLVGDVDRC